MDKHCSHDYISDVSYLYLICIIYQASHELGITAYKYANMALKLQIGFLSYTNRKKALDVTKKWDFYLQNNTSDDLNADDLSNNFLLYKNLIFAASNRE